ncbi:MAG: diaminopimelate decarboxylase, partial [Lachnospiraceae bacterium]|nr:diaminopimelate decarboxylase [Lachnospiraceae bacterium]
EPLDFKADLVGRCCESGDIIQKDVLFPTSVKRYDIIAVATTGAYNYSMASNYNRLTRPAVVMLKDGKDFVVVKKESLDYLVANDI